MMLTLWQAWLHTARFSHRRLLDLTHRGWSETEGPDNEEGDVFTLAAAAYVGIELHSRPGFIPALGSRPALSLTSSRLLPLLWAGANLATCHLCTRLRLCTKLWSEDTAFWIE